MSWGFTRCDYCRVLWNRDRNRSLNIFSLVVQASAAATHLPYLCPRAQPVRSGTAARQPPPLALPTLVTNPSAVLLATNPVNVDNTYNVL